MRKPELLIPASSLEVLKTAVIFGADAVYIGGETFSLRAKAKNFSHEDMKEGIAFAHAHGVRVHVTANILAHNYDMEPARNYFQELAELAPDAIIVADPGMIMLAKENCPDIEIHLSTQANNTNYMTYRFWYGQGVKRVVSARELSLKEIKEIREQIPEDMEIESFIHGAMCISYMFLCIHGTAVLKMALYFPAAILHPVQVKGSSLPNLSKAHRTLLPTRWFQHHSAPVQRTRNAAYHQILPTLLLLVPA